MAYYNLFYNYKISSPLVSYLAYIMMDCVITTYHDPYDNEGNHKGMVYPTNIIVD